MHPRGLSLFWRAFAATAVALVLVAVLLIATPVRISARIALVEAVILVAGLGLILAMDFLLLRRAFRPLERLAARMETVDLLRPGQRLPDVRGGAIGRVVRAFNDMLDRLEAERRESGGRTLAAQEAERARIARGLHDEVGQVLTGVLLELGALAPAVAGERQGELAETKASVRQALEEVRRIARELRPEMLEHLGLVSALTELSRVLSRQSGLRIDLELEQALPALTEEAELAIYRVAQESLTNVARHAGATRVTVRLESGLESVVLTVSDDGRGFGDGGQPERHGGITGMRERALLVGGALAIRPRAGGGVEVRFEVSAAGEALPR
ncbi:MAG TPA: histidine kinase [Solirubrobacteraceae bacterium]|nr:histidine kinase [Solirubrobacteraceae bacterium]